MKSVAGDFIACRDSCQSANIRFLQPFVLYLKYAGLYYQLVKTRKTKTNQFIN